MATAGNTGNNKVQYMARIEGQRVHFLPVKIEDMSGL